MCEVCLCQDLGKPSQLDLPGQPALLASYMHDIEDQFM